MNNYKINGLRLRNFEGETDFHKMVAIIDACKETDQDEYCETIENLRVQYANLTNCDPTTDMIFLEMEGQTIAYSRVTWFQIVETKQYKLFSFFHLVPAFRQPEIGQLLLEWGENRLKNIAKEKSLAGEKVFCTETTETSRFSLDLYTSQGYTPERFFFSMKRPLDEIPEVSLPAGIKVGTPHPDQYREVWDASTEAFRDHWGYAEIQESEYQAFIQSRFYQPQLWQVAWDGDKVVGSVQNFIDELENQEYNRKRGYTEGISVLRPWRKRGIASALIARSMQMHKEQGMEEVALGVDSESLTGALDLYTNLGYRVYKKMIALHKPLSAI